MVRVSNKNEDINEKVVKAFQRLFISYSQAINSQEKMRGSVFQKRFKRIHVDSDRYISKLIHYIHFNPLVHGHDRKIEGWPYSSYKILVSGGETFLCRDEVFEWFGGRDGFLRFHSVDEDYRDVRDMQME